jgi:hypothetical protein
MTDLRQAAQQEPVAWLKEDWTGGHLNYETVYEGAFAAFPVYKHPPAAQPEQEPVAWMYTRLKDGSSIKLVEKRAEMPEGGWSLYKEEPLYTTPPAAQRKWAGLTDEEVAIASAEFDTKLKLAFHAGMYKAQIILRKKNDPTY